MNRNEKILVYGALLFSLACALAVIGGNAYTGPVNITSATVDDARTDPNVTIVWDVGPILNGTSGNYVQNGFGLDFDGVNDYVNVSKSASLNITGAFTVDVWFNVPQESAADNMIIASSRDVGPGFDGWTIGIAQTSGRVRFVLQTSTGAAIQQGAADVADGTYHHVVAVWTGASAYLYVDGVLVDGPDAVGGSILKKQAPTLIAEDTTGADLPLNGTVDEFRVYSRAIGSGEAQYSYLHKVPLDHASLEVWINFDTNVLDQSGSGNNGVTAGTPEYVTGIRGLSDLVFDGTGDYVDFGDSNVFDLGLNFVFENYVKVISVPTRKAIHSKWNIVGNAKQWFLRILTTGLLNIKVFGSLVDNDNFIELTGSHDFRDLADHHILLNYNLSATGQARIQLYVDGVNDTAAVISEGPTWVGGGMAAGGTEDLEFGALNGLAAFYPFNGTLDEFRIYNRTFLVPEILEHSAGTYLNDTGLVLYVDCDENVLDQSGNGNNGVINGDPEYGDGLAYVPVTTSLDGQVDLVDTTTGILFPIIENAPITPANYTNINMTSPGAVANYTYPLFQVDLYNIDVGALYTEVEAGFNTIIYANGSSVLDGHELTDGDSLVINGVTLSWNQYMDRFEGTTTSTIPAIITFDTLTSMLEPTYTITNGNITSAPTVIWTTDRLALIIPFLRVGDWPGAIIQMNIILMGQTVFWTFLLTAISVSIYNHSGAEVALLTWMLGWGTFAAVLHSQALTISLVFMAVGGGIYIAKFFLDRRTSI